MPSNLMRPRRVEAISVCHESIHPPSQRTQICMSDRPNRDSAARQDCFCEMINAIDVHICVSDFETHEILFMNRRMRIDFNTEAAEIGRASCRERV